MRPAASSLKSSFSIGWWLLGGFLLSILHGAGKPQRYFCQKCGEFFSTHTRGSKVALVLFILLALLSAWGLLSLFRNP